MIVSSKKLKKNDRLFVEGRPMTVKKVKKTKTGLIIHLYPINRRHTFKLYVPKHYTVRTVN